MLPAGGAIAPGEEQSTDCAGLQEAATVYVGHPDNRRTDGQTDRRTGTGCLAGTLVVLSVLPWLPPRRTHDHDPDDLAARFGTCRIPKAQWTHQAHLVVGLWHVHRFGGDEAMTRLRTGIRRLNEHHGTPNSTTGGYHETITGAYVQLLSAYLEAAPPTSPSACGRLDCSRARWPIRRFCSGSIARTTDVARSARGLG